MAGGKVNVPAKNVMPGDWLDEGEVIETSRTPSRCAITVKAFVVGRTRTLVFGADELVTIIPR